jgi:malate synthase
MAAFIPNRRDPAVTERAFAAVAKDKAREAGMGFDGTWVAHPDLVAVAQAEFDAVLHDRPNWVADDRHWSLGAAELLDTDCDGQVTLEVVRLQNRPVGIRYLISWLNGVSCSNRRPRMEDVATPRSPSQIWQWVHHAVRTEDGVLVARPSSADWPKP